MILLECHVTAFKKEQMFQVCLTLFLHRPPGGQTLNPVHRTSALCTRSTCLKHLTHEDDEVKIQPVFDYICAGLDVEGFFFQVENTFKLLIGIHKNETDEIHQMSYQNKKANFFNFSLQIH